MIVHLWRGDRWAKRVIRDDGIYQSPLLPGFSLSLAKLLAISDKYL